MGVKFIGPYQPLLVHACVQDLTPDKMSDFAKESD
jgi:hypothetical protein